MKKKKKKKGEYLKGEEEIRVGGGGMKADRIEGRGGAGRLLATVEVVVVALQKERTAIVDLAVAAAAEAAIFEPSERVRETPVKPSFLFRIVSFPSRKLPISLDRLPHSLAHLLVDLLTLGFGFWASGEGKGLF